MYHGHPQLCLRFARLWQLFQTTARALLGPQYELCTAGVAHNKILAKFASGMHKPAQQTVVTLECVPGLMAATPIPKLRQLGGKFGEEIMHALQISTVGEELLSKLPPPVRHIP